MRRWRAGIAVGTLTALGAMVPALGVSASAAARRPPPSVNVELVGSLTLAWQGEEARGCAAEGLCGVSGSLQMLPGGSSSSSPGPPPLELSDQSSVARVTETSATGAQITCADLVPVDFNLAVKRSSTGQLQAISAGPQFFGQMPSAGRCAGPTAGDLSALALPARKLGSHGYDLSGQTTFGAGPFTVTAISTVRALYRRGAGATIGGVPFGGGLTSSSATVVGVNGNGTSPSPHRIRTRLQENADVVYRIAGFSGALTTTFAGLAPPVCDPLGACGTTGELGETFSAGNATLDFFGLRFVKHRVGARTALADLRAGRLELSGGFEATLGGDTVSETLTGPDGSTCADRSTNPGVPLEGSTGAHGHSARLTLDSSQQANGGAPSSADPFRTSCPGPSSADILGRSSLATAAVPAGTLGARHLALTFRSSGPFTGTAYRGERGGSVVLSLVLVHASGGTHRIPIGAFPVPAAP